MKIIILFCCFIVAGASCTAGKKTEVAVEAFAYPEHFLSSAEKIHPARFPSLISAACDFELSRKDVSWFGRLEKNNIPAYPGNTTALDAVPIPGKQNLFAAFRPVGVSLLGKSGKIYFKYYLSGATSLKIELSVRDGERTGGMVITGLTADHWSEAAIDLGLLAGSDNAPVSFAGEKLNYLSFLAEREDKDRPLRFIIDDIIVFEEEKGIAEPSLKFPERVILLENFDNEEQHSLWFDSYRIERVSTENEPFRGAGKAVADKNGPGRRIRVSIDPPQHVGAVTRLSFRLYLKETSSLQVQIFDLTDMDNRHLVLKNLPQDKWQTINLNLTADAVRNDGTVTAFASGHLVDDIFFFIPGPVKGAEFLIDDLVLYDEGSR